MPVWDTLWRSARFSVDESQSSSKPVESSIELPLHRSVKRYINLTL
jgi:hypothetical protein